MWKFAAPELGKTASCKYEGFFDSCPSLRRAVKEGVGLWPLPCEASAAPTHCYPAPCSAPHRPSSSAVTGRGYVLLRMAS
jgi:hypothetical protein